MRGRITSFELLCYSDGRWTGYPVYLIIYKSIGSKAATGVIATMLFVLGFFGTYNAIAATSRQC